MLITPRDLAKILYNDEFENLSPEAQKFCLEKQFEVPGEYSESELKLVLKSKIITCWCNTIELVFAPWFFYKIKYPHKVSLKNQKKEYHTDKILIKNPEVFALQSTIYICCYCGRPLDDGFICHFCQIDFKLRKI